MNNTVRGLVLGVLVSLVGTANSRAATQWWDTASAAALQPGPGTWSTNAGDLYWATNVNGVGGPFAWVDGNDAYFDTTIGATATVNGVTANSIIFNGPGSAPKPNLFFPGTGPLTIGAGGFTWLGTVNITTVGCDVVVSSDQRWTVQSSLASGGAFTGRVSGAAITVPVSANPGMGVVFANANNSFNGLAVYGLNSYRSGPGVTGYAGGTALGTGAVTTLGLPGGSLTNYGAMTLEGVGNKSTRIADLNIASPAFLNFNSTGSTNTLVGSNLTRVGRATLVILPQNSALGTREVITFTNGTSLLWANNIVAPWIVNASLGGRFLTYGPNGFSNAPSVNAFNGAVSATQSVVIGNATALSGPAYAQVLQMPTGGSLIDLAGNDLTLGDNTYAGLLATYNVSITNSGVTGALNFGTAEGHICVANGYTLLIGAPINGTGALTQFGQGILTISNAALYAGPLVLEGGTVNVIPTSDVTLSNGIVGMVSLVKAGPNTLTFSGSPGTNCVVGSLQVNGGALVLTNNARLVNLFVASYVGNAKPNTKAVVANGSSWNNRGNSLYVGSGAGATGDVLWIDGGGVGGSAVVTNATLLVGGGDATALGNTVIITNGGVLGTFGNSYIGNTSSSNTVIVTGSNSAWSAASGAYLYIGNGAGVNGNLLRVENGGTAWVPNRFYIGPNAGANGNGLWVRTGGSFSWGGDGSVIYFGAVSSTGNWITVSDGGLLTAASTAYIQFEGVSNVMTVAGTGTVVNSPVIVGNSQSSLGQLLIVTNGGTLISSRVGNVYAAYHGTNNTVVVTEPGSTWSVTASTDLRVGYDSGSAGNVAVSNTLRIVNGGAVNAIGSTALYVGGSTVAQSYNSVALASGGIFDGNAMTVGAGPGNNITNAGGVYQFSIAAPALTVPAANRIFINGGTISFRSITNADVFCNQGGKSLDSTTKMAWLGTNTFRLNNATNAAAGQTCTFASGTATNFARLELNNNSTYRGGAVTIGSGGSLMVSTGVSTVASNLTFLSGSKLEVTINATNDYSRLVVQGTNLTLGGTLQVSLGSAPPKAGATYQIVSATVPTAWNGSSFDNEPVVTPCYLGTPYPMSVRKDASGVSLLYYDLRKGTLLYIR